MLICKHVFQFRFNFSSTFDCGIIVDSILAWDWCKKKKKHPINDSYETRKKLLMSKVKWE